MRRSKRPGRSRAGSRTSGRLVAAMTMTPSSPVKPSISVRIWFSVCSRSSLPPIWPPAERGPADGVELVDEDDRRGRVLGLVEEVAHAAGADADEHLDELRGRQPEEGHLGLAGHGPGQQRLAGAGLAREQHAARDAGARACGSARDAQEVDDLGELGLGLVDAGHVGEGGALLLGLVLVHLGPAEHAHHAAHAARAAGRLGAPRVPDEQPPEQQGRAEEGKQRLPPGRAERLGVDDSTPLACSSASRSPVPKAGSWVLKWV